MPYTIQMNEIQRLMILQAMKNLPSHQAFIHVDHADQMAFDTPQEEYEALVRMFQGLPEVQKDGPDDLIHGFCL